MKILFLCHNLPYPPDIGMAVRSFHTLRQLSKAADVRALCLFRSGSSQRAADVAGSLQHLNRYAQTQAFPLSHTRSWTRRITDHLRSLMHRRVYTRFLYRCPAFSRALRAETIRYPPDLVHLDSLDLIGYLPELHEYTLVCAHHNVESELLRRRAQKTSNPAVQQYLRLQSAWYAREEREHLSAFDLNVAVSETDRNLLLQRSPSARVEVAPNGVDIDFFRPTETGPDQTSPRRIAFLGSLEWLPNRDGLDFFVDEILPHLRGLLPAVEILVIGRCSDAHRRKYSERYGIELAGHVEDIRPYLRSASCTFVPLRVGGGTRLKITTAWAMGLPTVSTSLGAEGLDARTGENILIEDDPKRFAQALHRVLTDTDLSQRLARTGRATAVSTYSWDVIGSRMRQWYGELMPRPSVP